jgi:hypothetical protein
MLPELLQQTQGLSFEPGWLMRVSQLVGGASALYIGIRGTVVWGFLLSAWLLLLFVLTVAHFVFPGIN